MVIPVDNTDNYPPTVENRKDTDRHGELAFVEQVKRAEQLTADRDRFSL